MDSWICTRTEARGFIGSDGAVFRYRYAERPADAKVPLVVFLHGAGERGDDNTAQLVHGVTEIVRWFDANEQGFRLIAGQVPAEGKWADTPWEATTHIFNAKPTESMRLLLELIEAQMGDPAIDNTRIYATGISMGGYGTWDLICRRPEVFAAAIPICGGGDATQAPRIARMPIWVFHGSADDAVPVANSRNMLSALWAAGSNAHYREYPDYSHNVWSATYGDASVLDWFFAQHKD